MCIVTTCFDKCFFHVIAGRHIFYKSLSLPLGSFQPPNSCFLSNKCIIYHNLSFISRIKVSSRIQVKFSYLLSIFNVLSTIFFIHEMFLKNSELLRKHVFLRSCQIDFLFSVTRAHAKKLGALNLFIQKLARRSFLFFVSEKKNTFRKFQF